MKLEPHIANEICGAAGSVGAAVAVVKSLLGGESVSGEDACRRLMAKAATSLNRILEIAGLPPGSLPQTAEEARRFLLAVAAEMTRILEAA